MKEKEIIEKLNMFKAVEPEEKWVENTRDFVLSKIPMANTESLDKYTILEKKSILYYGIRNLIGRYRLAYSMMSAFAIFAAILTVTASKNSLPGDPLYTVKIANENVLLAITSDDDKAALELEQAGNRLEELSVLSLKMSNSAQHDKVNELVSNFEEKLNNASTHLEKMKSNGDKTKVTDLAKVINTQSEKYTKVLAKSTENLPTDIKEKVSDKVAQAISATEKINTSALLVIAESENDAELRNKIEEKIGYMENVISTMETGDKVISEENKVKIEEARGKLVAAKKNLSENNLVEALNNIVATEEIISNLSDTNIEVKVDNGKEADLDGNTDEANKSTTTTKNVSDEIIVDTKKILVPINPVPAE